MARPKRSSTTLQKAETRQAALQSISPTLDLGNDLTLTRYAALIQTLRTQVTGYNSALSDLDDRSRQIKGTEQELRDLSEQMLLGVAAKYGKNSGEYGKAGGVPKGERRRANRLSTSESGGELPPMAIASPTNSNAAALVNGNGNGNGESSRLLNNSTYCPQEFLQNFFSRVDILNLGRLRSGVRNPTNNSFFDNETTLPRIRGLGAFQKWCKAQSL